MTTIIYQTPSILIGRNQWAISVLRTEQDDVMIIPQFRQSGGDWRNPAEFSAPVPAGVLISLLNPSTLISLARAVETANAARSIVP